MPRTSGSCLAFFIPGAAIVGVGQAGALISSAMTISHVKLYSATAPTVAALICDININGASIFTTGLNLPTVAVGTNAVNSRIPDVTTLAAGDRLTVDVDQVGTVTGGAPLLVTVVLV